MQVQSYLFFDGRCEEAIEFYKKTLGAKVEMLMRFKEARRQQGAAPAPKIRSCTRPASAIRASGSDGMAQGKPDFKGFSLVIERQGRGRGRAPVQGAVRRRPVHQPLIQTFFSPRFGMLADKFGVGWMVVVEQERRQRTA